MPKIKRAVMATILLAIALLAQSTPAEAFNVLGPKEHFAPGSTVYVCWADAPPQGTNGSISATYWYAIKQMDVQAYDLTFSTYGSTTYIGACNSNTMQGKRTYKLFWANNILNQANPPGTTIADSRDNNGYVWQASTFINPDLNWWTLTATQDCINWGCRPDLFTMAMHETGHAMGLAHRGWIGSTPPEHPWTWCDGGYYVSQVNLACRHVDDRGIYMGRDVMYEAAADGYKRFLTADDIAGINYWYR